jgi:threonine dehydratase
VVVVPVGGGGLIAGIALALAKRLPQTKIIAAEAAGAPQLSASLARGEPASIGNAVDTIADGLATGRIGQLPFAVIRAHVQRVVSVDDAEIGEAVLLMLERLKLLTEGAGAAALAAVLKLGAELAGALVVAIVSGGNIDINLLDRIIGHGLAKAGRLLRFTTNLHDRPGELQKLLSLISEADANVRTIDHNRTRLNIPIGYACVMVEVETRSRQHVIEIRERLVQAGYAITVEGD